MRDDKRRVCQQLYFIGALPLQKHSTLPDIESSDVGTERLKEVRVLLRSDQVIKAQKAR